MMNLANRIIDHYERHAHAWDADRRAAVWNDKPWHDRFIAALPRPANVLDLGCGSGSPVARHMVQSGLGVTGVDSSPTLISLCRQRLPDQKWLVQDMRLLRLSRQFDGVLAWDSFFHLEPGDQRRMFDVFARHATPSAILMFNSGPAQAKPSENIGAILSIMRASAPMNIETYFAASGLRSSRMRLKTGKREAAAPSGLLGPWRTARNRIPKS